MPVYKTYPYSFKSDGTIQEEYLNTVIDGFTHYATFGIR